MKPEKKAGCIMMAIGASEIWALWGASFTIPAQQLGSLMLGPAPVAGWIAAAIVATVFVVATRSRFSLIAERFLEVSPIKLGGILFGVLAGVAEEIWFRKILMDAAAHREVGILGQLALSAIIFGIAHGVWGLFGGQWRAGVRAIAATSALGAALAATYLISDRQIAPCIWAHVALDVLLEPWLLLAVITNKRPSGDVELRSVGT